jgi:hypothetical protein
MDETRFRREVEHLVSSPERHQDSRGGIDLIDDPVVPILADTFRVSQQLVVIRLCMLGYFAPYVKG